MRDKKIRTEIYAIFVEYVMKSLLICSLDYEVSAWISQTLQRIWKIFLE